MTNTRLLARDEVPTELTWDLTLLYPSDDAMRADLDDTLLLADKLSGFAGHLNGAKELLAALNTHKQIETDLTVTPPMQPPTPCLGRQPRRPRRSPPRKPFWNRKF
ncbi:MAG: hypothetical protein E7I21_06320 [Limosilactobacillus fermentum]|nr:hypothetical protein [Limosilactobacillus fermentum]